MKSDNILKIKYNIPQIFLETSRAAAELSVVNLMKAKGNHSIDYDASVRFAAVNISIVTAYQCLESFCNGLLDIKFKEVQETNKNPHDLRILFKDKKYKKYFESEELFQKLIDGELVEKLKALASSHYINPIHEIDGKLWSEVTQIVRDFRHFIIHPKRDEKFQENMTAIMEKYPAGTYYRIVEEVLKYYFTQTKNEIPDWLEKNILLRFLNSKDISNGKKN